MQDHARARLRGFASAAVTSSAALGGGDPPLTQPLRGPSQALTLDPRLWQNGRPRRKSRSFSARV